MPQILFVFKSRTQLNYPTILNGHVYMLSFVPFILSKNTVIDKNIWAVDEIGGGGGGGILRNVSCLADIILRYARYNCRDSFFITTSSFASWLENSSKTLSEGWLMHSPHTGPVVRKALCHHYTVQRQTFERTGLSYGSISLYVVCMTSRYSCQLLYVWYGFCDTIITSTVRPFPRVLSG